MSRWAGALFLGAALATAGDLLVRHLYERVVGDDEPDEGQAMISQCPMCKGAGAVRVRPHDE